MARKTTLQALKQIICEFLVLEMQPSTQNILHSYHDTQKSLSHGSQNCFSCLFPVHCTVVVVSVCAACFACVILTCTDSDIVKFLCPYVNTPWCKII